MPVSIKIDTKDIQNVVKALTRIDQKLSTALGKSSAEFGAYMRYSAALENGATIKFKATRPADVRERAEDARVLERIFQGGADTKGIAIVTRHATQTIVELPPRPHIVPAVEETKKDIVRVLLTHTLTLFKKAYEEKSVNYDTIIANVWSAALNNKPRQVAVRKTAQLKIYEFGLHRRSITGYSPRRSDADIMADQAQSQGPAK